MKKSGGICIASILAISRNILVEPHFIVQLNLAKVVVLKEWPSPSEMVGGRV
jgi:hypothetical protein